MHERKEGQFDWSGDLNLRKFLEIVKKNDLYAIVRMGPFCHGEIRNGGGARGGTGRRSSWVGR